MENVKDFKNTAGAAMRESEVTDVISNIKDKYHDLEQQARSAAENAVDFVKRHPIYSVVGAATAGIILGALVKKM